MECERPQDGELRQGDIFAANPGTDLWQDPLRRFGVVLSADCDIAQKKTGPNLVYAPIVGLHNFVSLLWLPAQAVKAWHSGCERLAKTLSKLGIEQTSCDSILQKSPADFEQFATRVRSLQSIHDGEKNLKLLADLRQKLIELKVFHSPLPAGSIDDLKQRLVKYFKIDDMLRNTSAPSQERYRAQLNNALQSLGDKERLDTWPICELIGLDGDMKDDEPFGFVVILRQFSLVPIQQVKLKRTEWQNDREGLLRICRLRGIYKTDLLQRFANLFVRVGVEDERLEIHKRMFERAANKLLSGGSK